MSHQIPPSLMFSHEQNYVQLRPNEVGSVLALLASPRKDGVSKTEILTNAFLAGCKKAGAEVDTIHLREKKINQCVGCFTCWTKTPATCIFKDDVAEIMEKADAADLVVYASPLYHFGIIALMKKYIERTLPELKPFLEPRENGKTGHPHREGFKATQNIVVIGVCGFPEVSHFGAFSANFHYIANSGGENGHRIVAEIYRPLSEILNNPFYQEESDRVLAAAENAGKDLIKKGYVDASTIDAIAEVRLEKANIYKATNTAWETCIQEGRTMPDLQKKLRE